MRECKKGRNAVESLEPEQLFSAMPPLEALKLLSSLKVSLKTSRKGSHFDISRAHFMPKARRELYVELLDEDPMKQKGFVGLDHEYNISKHLLITVIVNNVSRYITGYVQDRYDSSRV